MPVAPRPGPPEDPTPLARWDDDASSDPALVWWAQLDHRYLVEVIRTSGGEVAALHIWDHPAGDRLVAEHRVHLADDAESGPTIEDVVAWQRLAVETVDGATDHPKHKEKRS